MDIEKLSSMGWRALVGLDAGIGNAYAGYANRQESYLKP
jgi:hypothetical protein